MNIDKIDLIENQWGLFFGVIFFIKQEETPSFLTSLWMSEDSVFLNVVERFAYWLAFPLFMSLPKGSDSIPSPLESHPLSNSYLPH